MCYYGSKYKDAKTESLISYLKSPGFSPISSKAIFTCTSIGSALPQLGREAGTCRSLSTPCSSGEPLRAVLLPVDPRRGPPDDATDCLVILPAPCSADIPLHTGWRAARRSDGLGALPPQDGLPCVLLGIGQGFGRGWSRSLGADSRTSQAAGGI